MTTELTGDSGLTPTEAALFAHDLKNLLTTVLGHADIQFMRLDDVGGLKTDLGSSLDAIRLSCGRAVDLCDDLMAVARGGLDRRESVPLGEVAETAARLVQARADRTVHCECLGDPEVAVYGSRLSLERAALNLAWNAFEAIREAEGAEPTIQLRWGESDAGCWLEVADNGPGLPDGRLAGLLDPYRSSKGGPRSTSVRGLGLQATAQIMRCHGGRLTGRNRTSGGAKIRMEFGLERELDFEAGA